MDKQPIEQAVFTSTSGAGGYRIVASSFGVGDADAKELAAWGPSQDSVIDPDPTAESLNFHPLPSGAYCVSRSATLEGTRRGAGRRVHTHCLIVPPETMARFANNPFALVRAASVDGIWRIDDPSEPIMDPLCLPGGAAAVDEALLGLLAANPGGEHVAALVQEARGAVCLAVGGAPSPAALIAGLFSCLPQECRLEFSFSTGLKFSPRRPFRVVALSGDPAQRRWVAGYANVAVLNLHGGERPPSVPLDGWGQLIRRSLITGQIPFLAAQLSKRRFKLSLEDLPVLGLQLQEELDAVELGGRRPIEASTVLAPRSLRNAHAAHGRFSPKNADASNASTANRPLEPAIDSPEVLDKLERLDDLVYESINGQPDAFAQLQAAWPVLLDELGEEMASESREKYLRYALSIWDECADSEGIRQSDRAVQALDVLCLLFGET
ncbi:MAG: hypothetical protein JW959_11040 [Pirellulales bacterium]|nr:hypothetical protein [Pirellulales bacterium]